MVYQGHDEKSRRTDHDTDPDSDRATGLAKGPASATITGPGIDEPIELLDLASRACTRVEGFNGQEYVRQSVRQPQGYIAPGYPNIEVPTLPFSEAELEQSPWLSA